MYLYRFAHILLFKNIYVYLFMYVHTHLEKVVFGNAESKLSFHHLYIIENDTLNEILW